MISLFAVCARHLNTEVGQFSLERRRLVSLGLSSGKMNARRCRLSRCFSRLPIHTSTRNWGLVENVLKVAKVVGKKKKKKIKERCVQKPCTHHFLQALATCQLRQWLYISAQAPLIKSSTCALRPIDWDPVLPFEVTGVFVSTASHSLPFFLSADVKHHLSWAVLEWQSVFRWLLTSAELLSLCVAQMSSGAVVCEEASVTANWLFNIWCAYARESGWGSFAFCFFFFCFCYCLFANFQIYKQRLPG